MLIEPSADGFMREHLATNDLSEALLNLRDEPAVVIDEALDRLVRQRLGGAAAFTSKPGQLGLGIGREVQLR